MADSIKLMREAITKGDVDAVEDLLQKGINVNTRDKESGETFLWLAAKEENEKIFNLLLAKGANVNSKNADGETPLHALAVHSRPLLYGVKRTIGTNMATELLNRGANVDAMQYEQRTPLDCAASRGQVELVKLFLKYGADVDVVNENNDTPLRNALLETRDGDNLADIVQILIDHGSEANQYDNFNRTCPLDTACYWGKYIVKIFLKNGANPNVLVGVDGHSLLMSQMLGPGEKNPESIRTLLKYGANVNFVTEYDEETVLDDDNDSDCSEVVLEHIALLQALKLKVHKALYNAIKENEYYKHYFLKCKKELAEAKKDTLTDESTVNCFNLLVDSKKKLVKYADDEEFVEEFENGYLPHPYPIYGEIMTRRFERGIEIRRKTFDKAVVTLSDLWPILKSTPMIIKDILYCLSVEQLEKI